MAGMDGTEKKLDHKKLNFGPINQDIFNWSEERRKSIASLPTSLEGALDALEADYDFLLKGGVFSEEIIKTWIANKRKEVKQINDRPHPYEFEMYFDI